MNAQQLVNDAIKAVQDGRIPQCSDAALQDYLVAAEQWEAAGYPLTQTKLIIESIRHEKDRRQKERHQSQLLHEAERRHQELKTDVRRMFDENALDSDTKHAQSLAVSQEANFLSRKAIKIARGSVAATIIIGVGAVIVGHLDSTRTSMSPPSALPIREMPQLAPMPQTVLPTPKPIQTNPIVVATNVPAKK